MDEVQAKAKIIRENDEDGNYQIWIVDDNGDTYGSVIVVRSIEMNV